jgi:hypothetical protein
MLRSFVALPLFLLAACGGADPVGVEGGARPREARLESPATPAAAPLAATTPLLAPDHASAGAALVYGDHSAALTVRGGDYGWLQFTAAAGDAVDLSARAYAAATPQTVLYVLDGANRVVASNQSAGVHGVSAHLAFVLAAAGEYHIAVGDLFRRDASYVVTLAGSAIDACQADRDCTTVLAGGCCPTGALAAIANGAQDRYHALSLCPPHPDVLLCPRILIEDTRVAVCDQAAQRCVLVPGPDSPVLDPPATSTDPAAIEAIVCGGLIPRATCPASYYCKPDGPGADVTGHCAALPPGGE